MTNITIPPEALEAALEAFAHASGLGIFPDDENDEEWREDLQNGMRAACLAMLRNWPGMRLGKYPYSAGPDDRIILPLPKEPSDDK
jgi:hypothetical protein